MLAFIWQSMKIVFFMHQRQYFIWERDKNEKGDVILFDTQMDHVSEASIFSWWSITPGQQVLLMMMAEWWTLNEEQLFTGKLDDRVYAITSYSNKNSNLKLHRHVSWCSCQVIQYVLLQIYRNIKNWYKKSPKRKLI